MPTQKFDHIPVEQPRLLHVAGVARAVQDAHLAIRDTLLQRERRFVDRVLAAAQDDRRAGDALSMAQQAVIMHKHEARIELWDNLKVLAPGKTKVEGSWREQKGYREPNDAS